MHTLHTHTRQEPTNAPKLLLKQATKRWSSSCPLFLQPLVRGEPIRDSDGGSHPCQHEHQQEVVKVGVEHIVRLGRRHAGPEEVEPQRQHQGRRLQAGGLGEHPMYPLDNLGSGRIITVFVPSRPTEGNLSLQWMIGAVNSLVAGTMFSCTPVGYYARVTYPD